jgi:hypothetical protein
MLNDTLGWMLHIDYTNGHYKKNYTTKIDVEIIEACYKKDDTKKCYIWLCTWPKHMDVILEHFTKEYTCGRMVHRELMMHMEDAQVQECYTIMT